MSLIITLTPRAIANLRKMASQHGVKTNKLATDTMEAVFSGDCAYILLEPAPSAEKFEECKQAIEQILGNCKRARIGEVIEQGEKHAKEISNSEHGLNDENSGKNTEHD